MRLLVPLLCIVFFSQCKKEVENPDLAKPLSDAYFEHRLSNAHVKQIIAESERLVVNDSLKGLEYKRELYSALTSGADSVEIRKIQNKYKQ